MRIAVYCSAKDIILEEYLSLGDALGKWIAEHGHTLVYGGATGGLMTRTSDAARAAGGEVIGVVPQRIIAAGRLAQNCTTQYIVSSMAERKQMMRDVADCFVCLPITKASMKAYAVKPRICAHSVSCRSKKPTRHNTLAHLTICMNCSHPLIR